MILERICRTAKPTAFHKKLIKALLSEPYHLPNLLNIVISEGKLAAFEMACRPY